MFLNDTLSIDDVYHFAGYKATTVDPGFRFSVIVVIVCIVVNLCLPILVGVAALWDRRRPKHDFNSAKADANETDMTRKPASHASQGLQSMMSFMVSECAKRIFPVAESTSSILDQLASKSGKVNNSSQIYSPVSTDDVTSVSSESVDHDIISSVHGNQMSPTCHPKLQEEDEPSSLWEQFLEIADWDVESRELTALTIPYTIQGCTAGLFQTINVAIIGHYLGVAEANAYIIVASLLEFSQTLTYGFGGAVGTLVPHADGAGNDVLAGRYLQLALIFCSITSIPTILVWSHNVGVAVLWFGFDEETATLSQRLAYSMLVIVFVRSIDHGIHQFLNVTGHEKYSTIVQILHYTIQSVSIVGAVSLGIKDLMYVGLIQALLGVLLSLASFTFILLRGWTDKYWEGFAQTLSLRDGQALRNMMITAIPLSVSWFLTFGEWQLLTIFASSMGPAEVAAWGILGFIWDVFGHITSGFAEAAVCRVGYRMGAGQPHSAKIAAYKSVYMGIIVAVLSTGGLFLISAYLPVWLTPDPTLQRMIFDCLPLIGFGQILMVVGTVTWSIVGAQGRIRLATIVELISSWCIAIPCCVISLYVFNYNLLGFVASLIFGYTVGGVVMGFIILRSDWNALSQSVIASNANEEIAWAVNESEESLYNAQ